MSLITLLQDHFRGTLASLAPGAEQYVSLIRQAQDPKHGDYQANFAMPLGKMLGRKPQEIARAVIAALPASDMIEPPVVAGPGFINLRLRDDWLAACVGGLINHPRLGITPVSEPKTYVVEYSSVNVAKPMHVGHLRSTIIGEALKRIIGYLGHRVIADNHLGDWGTQFGMLIYGYKNFLDRANYETDRVGELNRLYLHVRKLMKESDGEEGNTEADIAARAETAKLHAGDAENLAIWREFMPACLDEIAPTYQQLDVTFDEMLGESFYQPMLADVVDELLAKGVVHESNGALIYVHPEDRAKPPEERPRIAIVRKRDGAFTYTTTDLATIRYRATEWRPDYALYVVDFRQSDHFAMVFAAAQEAGYEVGGLSHVSFGSVLGKDGKPLKSRDGTAVLLEDLLADALSQGLAKYDATSQVRAEIGHEPRELSQADKRNIAEAVGLGAVKYFDLSQNRKSDYVYDPDKMLATDGNTATYMQYAYARCQSIFRKGEIDVDELRRDPPRIVITHPTERELALVLLRFQESLTLAATEFYPHYITSYLWDLAKTYSGFFQNCPVLKSPTTELKMSRLALCDLTARTINVALHLLGIRTLERM